MDKMDFFFSFSDIQKLKMHTFKRFWDTMECTEKLRDLRREPGWIWGT
jgi:hypothetical protein